MKMLGDTHLHTQHIGNQLNDNASEPPVLLKDGEVIGKLTTKEYVYDGYDVNEIKETCDW